MGAVSVAHAYWPRKTPKHAEWAHVVTNQPFRDRSRDVGQSIATLNCFLGLGRIGAARHRPRETASRPRARKKKKKYPLTARDLERIRWGRTRSGAAQRGENPVRRKT